MELKKDIILVFDGPDNVGKGTQIKKIRKFFQSSSFVVLNLEAPIGKDNQEKLSYGKENIKNYFRVLENLKDKKIPLILDRFHFSEYAYSFLRGGHQLNEILDIEKKFSLLKENLIIFTFVDKVENIQKRDDGLSAFDSEKTEQIEKLLNNFKEISQKSIFKNFVIDIENKDEEKVFEEILEKLKK